MNMAKQPGLNLTFLYTSTYSAASPGFSVVSQRLCTVTHVTKVLTQQQQSNTIRKD